MPLDQSRRDEGAEGLGRFGGEALLSLDSGRERDLSRPMQRMALGRTETRREVVPDGPNQNNGFSCGLSLTSNTRRAEQAHALQGPQAEWQQRRERRWVGIELEVKRLED